VLAALLGSFGALLPVVGFVAVAGAEALGPADCPPQPFGRRWFGNLVLYLLSGGVFMLPKVAAFVAAIGAQVSQFGLLHWLGPPMAVQILLGVLALDGISFGMHRLFHGPTWLWRLHAVHHSDPEVDVTTAIRHHPGETLVGVLVSGTAAGVIGCPPLAVAVYAALDWVVGLIAHSTLTLPRWLPAGLARLVVTPRFHRLHHSRRQPETDSNYGQVFAFWDVLFGTFRANGGDIECGLDAFRDARSQSPQRLLMQPFRPQSPPTTTPAPP
jgi:sterol desaturase/sphingolipid hydroxylase (fatty acid hydroxylase superfamily)